MTPADPRSARPVRIGAGQRPARLRRRTCYSDRCATQEDLRELRCATTFFELAEGLEPSTSCLQDRGRSPGSPRLTCTNTFTYAGTALVVRSTCDTKAPQSPHLSLPVSHTRPPLGSFSTAGGRPTGTRACHPRVRTGPLLSPRTAGMGPARPRPQPSPGARPRTPGVAATSRHESAQDACVSPPTRRTQETATGAWKWTPAPLSGGRGRGRRYGPRSAWPRSPRGRAR